MGVRGGGLVKTGAQGKGSSIQTEVWCGSPRESILSALAGATLTILATSEVTYLSVFKETSFPPSPPFYEIIGVPYCLGLNYNLIQ